MAAEALFGARLPQARALAEALAGEGPIRGLIGPREVDRLWSRHLLNCAAVSEVLPTGASVADVGSGAGLPGLVLAVARPDLHLTLIEPMQRRVDWLNEASAELSLSQVQVVRAKAEQLHGRQTFDVVTARAVAALPKLLEWTWPLVGERGCLLAMKGSQAPSEIIEAASALDALHLRAVVLTAGASLLDEPTTLIRVTRAPAGLPSDF